MSIPAKRKNHKNKAALSSPDHQFTTVEEAAQAKTDHAWETVLKHVDWTKLDSLRKQEQDLPQ